MVAIRDRLRYLDLVEWRIREATPDELYRLEGAMLCLRKVLELIAYSSLVANEEAMSDVVDDIGSMWRAQKILDKIERLNPNFFPQPVVFHGLEDGVISFSLNPEPDVFQRADFKFLYDKCGEYLHVLNPFESGGDWSLRFPPTEWIRRIRALLDCHRVVLVGGDIGVVKMNGWGSDGPGPLFHHAGPMGRGPIWGARSKAKPLNPDD